MLGELKPHDFLLVTHAKHVHFFGVQGEVRVMPSTSTLSSTMAALAGAPPLTTRHFVLRPSRLGCLRCGASRTT